ncbi:oligosaccharide flippase family protein [Glaciecola petra]|uniref:Oligosaccharide flippase family protein n=1 Tax=Glaciecola petra TaxID=3075602 RepID=A0ABU2ZMB3_9ALTE|nr:oligosaccharide flippase family protein [Aestuariibacter sp. P117]MDT0593762.1 oligosaccharide flippase family protein [Aestuariibacter sp. P117]
MNHHKGKENSELADSDAGEFSASDGQNHTNWKLLKNGVALSLGRNLNSILRLVIAAIIARQFGADTFAEYSLLLAIMMIAEWFMDFGTTDVFVREVSKDKASFSQRLASLCLLKSVQIPLGIAAMIAMLAIFHTTVDMMRAGIFIAIGLFAYGFVSVYRTVFKIHLTMEKEMLAEFISIVLTIPFIWLALYLDQGILGIAFCLGLSRASFLAFCVYFSERRFLTLTGSSFAQAKDLWNASYLIGFIGLFSVLNNAIEILMLTKFSSLTDVAIFSAAQKLVWPLFMILSAVGTVFYPVLARYWIDNKKKFYTATQQAFSIIALLGFLAVSGIYSGADFMMSLISPELIIGVDALHLLMLMCLFKSFSASLGPILFIAGAVKTAFTFFTFAVIVKIILLLIITGDYGYFGTAVVSVSVELFIVFPLTLFYLKTKAQCSINFVSAGLLCLTCAITILVFEYLIELPSAAELVLAPISMLGMVLLTKQTSIAKVMSIIRLRNDVSES